MTSMTGGARRRVLKVLPAVGLTAIALGVAGCKATGGGFIPSAVGADAAHFGFVMQTNKGDNVVHGTYRDGYVQLRFDGGSVSMNLNPCATWTVDYVSTSADNPGSGTAQVVICDNGKAGPTNDDSLSIQIQSGPYAGYSNSGTLAGGNLQINQGKNDGPFSAHTRRHRHRH
jgi:hypothetical protein